MYEYNYTYFASQSDCLGCAVLLCFVCLFVCLMRVEKEGRKKQARSNKQTFFNES